MSGFLAATLWTAQALGQSPALEGELLLDKIRWARAALGQPPLSGPEEELLALGVFLQGTGRNAEARALFWQIVSRFPDSPDLGEAWLGIGDTHEAEGQHRAAHEAYLEASRYLTGHRRVLALDRSAWQLTRLGEHERAFTTVVEALEHSFGSGQTPTPALLAIQREALRDLVAFSALIDADQHPSRSPSGLTHLEILWDLHARMAGLCRQQGEVERAADIEGWLHALIASAPIR